MRQNNLVLMFGILALLLVGFSSATLDVTGIPSDLLREGGSFTLVISTNETENITSIDVLDSQSILDEFSYNQILPIALNNSSVSVEVTYSIKEDFVFEYKTSYSVDLKIEADVSDNYEKAINFKTNKNYFNYSISQNRGNLVIEDSRMSFSLLEGLGSSRDAIFFPFDEIELEFRVENKGEWDIRNVEFKVCLYDISKDYCVYDEDDFRISNDRFSLRKNSRETVTMSVYLDVSDLEVDSRYYELHISATGEIDDRDSEYYRNDTSVSNVLDFEMVTGQKQFVIINEISSNSIANEFACGEFITISAKAWNIGDRDLDDDEVFIHAYSSELEINETITFDKGIYYMDYEPFSFSFFVPKDIENGNYKIWLGAYSDERFYDRYLFEVEKVKSEYSYNVEILCDEADPTITAALGSVAKVGKELIITGTIANERSYSQKYTFSLEGYSGWADLVSMTPTEKTLEAGESVDYTIVFKVTEAGEKDFALKITDESGNDTLQKVSIEISGGLFSNLDETLVTYLVAGVLVLLIVLLVVLIAVASSKKKRRSIAMHN